MKPISAFKARIRRSALVLLSILAIFLITFGIYGCTIYRYNHTLRSSQGSSHADNVSADLHPRGQATDTWKKNDPSLPEPLCGMIYELTVTNGSPAELTDWSFRLNIPAACYLNNAWCGTVEIHQFQGKTETVQTLDLRDIQRSTLRLRYQVSGNDLLIPLNTGDYLIYLPGGQDGEVPVKPAHGKASSVNAGLIFYSSAPTLDFSDTTLNYYLFRHHLAGPAAIVYGVLLGLWLIAAILFTVLSLLTRQYERRLAGQEKLIREFLDVFSSFVDAKDPYTYGHSKRVAYYSRKIAEKLGLPPETCRHIYDTALLHDIGKCYVPDTILKKPDRLTEEEFEIIKTHPQKGADMVQKLSSIPEIQDGILCHHERFDGSGYPRGLKGTDIPLIGRIISVADAYDAMSSNRVYRRKLSPDRIIEELRRGSGTQFDPAVVAAFLQVLADQKAAPFPDCPPANTNTPPLKQA